MAYKDTSFAIFCTYAPSDGKDTEFLHKIRRAQLDSEETHSAILGDLNCTIDADMDRVGYTRPSLAMQSNYIRVARIRRSSRCI